MGIGDDLMFLGEAERIHQKTGKTIKPMYHSGWSPFFEGLDWLSTEGKITINARDTDKKTDVHVNYYERGREQTIFGQRLLFRNYKPKPYKIPFNYEEVDWAHNTLKDNDVNPKFILINPDYKNTFYSDNKNWGFKKYQKLTNLLKEHYQVVRLMPGGIYKEPELENAINIKTNDVRKGLALVSFATFGVAYDGLINHALAGFQIPGVIICGGLADESIIGYKTSTYIKYNHPRTPCGSTYSCPHCYEANKSITVEEVYQACLKYL